MGKLFTILLVASFACRYLAGHWPWQIWASWNRPAPGDQARRLLGVDRRAGRAEILEAHKRLIAQVHPDRGGDVRLVYEANDARDVLLEALGPDKNRAQRP